MSTIPSTKKELPMNQKNKRIDLYDIVKGIGILLVVSAHIFDSDLYHKIVYAFHMPLFLIITGMLIDLTKSSQKPLIKLFVSKFKSLMIPYIITELICIPLYYFRGGYSVNDIYWIVTDSLFLYVTKGAATWFLLGLFLAEMIYYLLLKCIPNKFIVMAIVTLGYVISLTIPVSNHHIRLIMRSISMMFFVMIGHQFAAFFKKERKFSINLIFLAVFFATALLNDNLNMVVLQYGNPFLSTLSSITGSALLISVSSYISKSKFKLINQLKNYFIFWGQETVIVICTHLIIMRYGIDIILDAGPYYPFVQALIIFTVVMILSYGLVMAKKILPKNKRKM